MSKEPETPSEKDLAREYVSVTMLKKELAHVESISREMEWMYHFWCALYNPSLGGMQIMEYSSVMTGNPLNIHLDKMSSINEVKPTSPDRFWKVCDTESRKKEETEGYSPLRGDWYVDPVDGKILSMTLVPAHLEGRIIVRQDDAEGIPLNLQALELDQALKLRESQKEMINRLGNLSPNGGKWFF